MEPIIGYFACIVFAAIIFVLAEIEKPAKTKNGVKRTIKKVRENTEFVVKVRYK